MVSVPLCLASEEPEAGPWRAEPLAGMRDWMAEEIPFLAGQRPWEHADLIVCGTPWIPFDPATEIVVAPPLAVSRPLP